MNSGDIFRHRLPLILTLLTTIPATTQQPLAAGDFTALRQLTYTLTDVNSGDFFATWNFTSPEKVCRSFAGVTCAAVDGELRVVVLSLGSGLSDSPGLAGAISGEGVYGLTELTQLILYPGIVTGFIPPEIGYRLKKLRVLSLTGNRLTGGIPESISGLHKLHTLDLSHNRLTGSIPPAISNSPALKVCVLAYNELVGELPEFSDECKLIHLDLRNNFLSGKLPKTTPFTLRYLSLSSNGLWGPLSLVTSPYLVYLDLSMNQLSGPIPDSLFSPSLTSLYLQRNNLSGEITLASVTGSTPVYVSGSIIDLSHNFISGEVPEFFVGVETLFLNNNRFVGSVPEGYVDNVFAGTMKTLYLQHNYIKSFPMEEGSGVGLPDGVALCLSYNCMVPPAVGLVACPASAGELVSRPFGQCSVFNSGNLLG